MRFTLFFVSAVLAFAQAPRYTVKDLGTLPDGHFSQAGFIDNTGTIVGIAAAANGTQHAVLWKKGGGQVADISTSIPSDLNSGAFGINAQGQASIQAETTATDPNNANFCLYGTGKVCQAFIYDNGAFNPVHSLGGYNSTVGNINARGEMSGLAETGMRDLDCPTHPLVNGTGPLTLNYQAVVWGPKASDFRILKPLPGDTVGQALSVNDSGEATGVTGSCANTVIPPFVTGPHMVVWDKNGNPTDIGNLGGNTNPNILGFGHSAFVINNRSQVTGVSTLPGNATYHAFLWSKETKMVDLGVLPGAVASAGLGLNNRGQVVGGSGDSTDVMGPSRAFLYPVNGKMSDLNELVEGESPLFLGVAFAISEAGEIVGMGFTEDGEPHAFLATPVKQQKPVAAAAPKNAAVLARQINLDGTGSTSPDGKALSYFWSIPQGSPSAAILHGDSPIPSVQFTTRGLYTFQLTVTDASGNAATDNATVNFLGN